MTEETVKNVEGRFKGLKKVAPNSLRHFTSSIKNNSSEYDYYPEYLFSRPLVMKKRINPPQFIIAQCQPKDQPSSSKLPLIDDKTQKETTAESISSDFVPHKVILNTPDDSSSCSSSFSSATSSSEDSHDWEKMSDIDVKRQKIIESKWGGYALNITLWEHANAPVVKIRRMDEISLDSMEYSGVLSDRMLGACSSFLTRSPETGLYVLSKCELTRENLTDISILYYHRYLQYIDLAYNNITDLTPLRGLPYLLYLNLSHNKLRSVLRFTPPWYLTYVNLSHNEITAIDDLSEFWSIVRLDLSHNQIEYITGLQNLKSLRYLNLAYNLIQCVENLDNLNIQELNLEYNCVSEFKSANPDSGIITLPNLRSILLGHNKLSTLEFFEGAYGLRLIDLNHNKIVDLLEVSHLKSLVYEVDFRGNACTEWPNYRDVVLFSMPSVMYIDGAIVSTTEKVSADTMFAPSMDLIAARSITKLFLLEQLNCLDIDMHVTPCDQASPPLIILSGPPAVKKAVLAKKIADNLPNRVRYCPSYTTRDPFDNEEFDSIYHFIKKEEFNEMARRGEFLSVEELLGHSYGFHINEIAAIAMEKKIGITHMDLHATKQMQGRYVNAKLVLTMTADEEVHRQWTSEKFEVFTWIKDSMENLLAVKVGRRHNSSHAESSESVSSKMDFIAEIINEVVNDLQLPTFSTNVRPQGTGATATDIIIESQTMLPKTLRRISQCETEDRKRITFRGEHDEYIATDNKPPNTIQKPESKHVGLKVILDEMSNVIIDDEFSKQARRRAKLLVRHSALELNNENEEGGTDSEESLSSDPDAMLVHYRSVPPEQLEDIYIAIVLTTRDIYLQQHISHPGFFSLVVLTDDFKKAYDTLVDFIYEMYINHPFRQRLFNPENDKMMQAMMPIKIQSIAEELRENMSTAKYQQKTLLSTYGMTSWTQPMPSRFVLDKKYAVNNLRSSTPSFQSKVLP